MALLLRTEGSGTQRDVLVFGSGAIGGAVVDHLHRRRSFAAMQLPVPWSQPTARAAMLKRIRSVVEPRACERPLSIVWAAGNAGFSATEDEAASELEAYRDVVALARGIRETAAPLSHTFHMISSAGGLYEGRAVRSATETPTPLRSYGRLKLAEERHAFDELPGGVTVYRPSSVYTAPRQGHRLGLIGTLIRNGMAQRPTTIVGALDTLRDYVMARDVGAYVAERALADNDDADVHMLVSGHGASILQVMTAVESVIRRRLHVRIAQSWNAQNITFVAAVKPPRFRVTPLSVGVRMVHSAALGRPINR